MKIIGNTTPREDQIYIFKGIAFGLAHAGSLNDARYFAKKVEDLIVKEVRYVHADKYLLERFCHILSKYNKFTKAETICFSHPK